MRPVPRCQARAAVHLGSTVPGARPSTVPPSCAASGAMTAALVIVPADPVLARPDSAQCGRATGSSVRSQVVLSGAPWIVRLSMGMRGHGVHRAARPGHKAPLGPRR
jgi:hypothetical protein